MRPQASDRPRNRCRWAPVRTRMGTVVATAMAAPTAPPQLVLAGHNDPGSAHRDLAAQANGWEPSIVIARTSRRLAWRCPKGHSCLSPSQTGPSTNGRSGVREQVGVARNQRARVHRSRCWLPQQMASDAAIPAKTASPAATLRNSSRDCSARTVVATSRYARDVARRSSASCFPHGAVRKALAMPATASDSLALSSRRSTCPRGRRRPARCRQSERCSASYPPIRQRRDPRPEVGCRSTGARGHAACRRAEATVLPQRGRQASELS